MVLMRYFTQQTLPYTEAGALPQFSQSSCLGLRTVDVDVSIYDAKYGESARSRQHLQGATLFLIKPGEKKRKEKRSVERPVDRDQLAASVVHLATNSRRHCHNLKYSFARWSKGMLMPTARKIKTQQIRLLLIHFCSASRC
jgi:hypothetical protein